MEVWIIHVPWMRVVTWRAFADLDVTDHKARAKACDRLWHEASTDGTLNGIARKDCAFRVVTE